MIKTRRDFLKAAPAAAAMARWRGWRTAERERLRVYFVGNSVTDTIRQAALAELAEAKGRRLIWGRQMIPGAPLQWIWEHPADGFTQEPFGHYPKALGEFEWDVLSLQPFDRQLEGSDDSDLSMARRFVELASQRSPKVEVLIYSRWPRRDEESMDRYKPLDYAAKWLRTYNAGAWDGTNETRDYFERLVTRLRETEPERSIRMVPVGDVLLALDEQMRGGRVAGLESVERLYQDGIHLNAVGSYVVGCTYFATLFRADPRGLPHESYDVMEPALAKAIQEVVWEVVRGCRWSGVES